MSEKLRAILVVCIAAAGLIAYPIWSRSHPPAQVRLGQDLKRCENAMNELMRQGASNTHEEREAILFDGCKDALGGGRPPN